MAESRQGCWVAVSQCFWGPPSSGKKVYTNPDIDNIEFEDLVSADEKAKAAPVQIITDVEKERIQTGKLSELLEEQRKQDEAKDAELRRQEELLRQEEEAYYAAKRAAAQKAKLASAVKQSQPEPEVKSSTTRSLAQSTTPSFSNRIPIPVIQEQPVSETSTAAAKPSSQLSPLPPPEPSITRKLSIPQAPSETLTGSGRASLQQPSPELPTVSKLPSQKGETEASVPVISSHCTESDEEEEDFDQFLESVKIAPQGSSTAVKDSSPDADVDFGYWETATELKTSINSSQGTVK